MKEFIVKHKQYLLSGVSFAIPFIACGGILIAAAIALAPMGATGPDFSNSPKLQVILDIGVTSFKLMLPVLAGYISYAIAGKPGLVAGFIGGFLSGEINAGFLGALLAGIIAGHIVNLIKKLPVPKILKPVMPILIIPIISSLAIGILMMKVIGVPIADFMVFLGEWLKGLSAGNAVVLAVLLGAMIAFDMGGPVNKAAFFFGAAMIKEGNAFVMGSVAAAICTPPLGMGLATLLGRKMWDEQEKEAGIAALGMGLMGITEGAIPFAASDPFRVIPCIMVGSITAAVIAMLGKAQDHAPHGGPIVLPVVDNKILYVIAILCGTFVTAVLINLVKKITSAKKGA
ncbi:MAG: fructose-specific PTS transporter subunit EIIC [Planctomycetaceae bacterium]|nr:fructose-specific PTS transporter subunit EIIC [Planctomycetaceae bacterium]